MSRRWVPAGGATKHSGKSGGVKTPYQTPSRFTFPANIPSYVDEVTSRTYPYWKHMIPKSVKLPLDIYEDLRNTRSSRLLARKLKFWLMYLQANEKIPKKNNAYKFQSKTRSKLQTGSLPSTRYSSRSYSKQRYYRPRSRQLYRSQRFKQRSTYWCNDKVHGHMGTYDKCRFNKRFGYMCYPTRSQWTNKPKRFRRWW